MTQLRFDFETASEVSADDTAMVRMAGGDGDSLAALMRKYERQLNNYFRKAVRDAYLADDMTQETFLRLWAKSAVFKPNGTFKAWMYKVARNILIDYTRERARKPERVPNGEYSEWCWGEIAERERPEDESPALDSKESLEQLLNLVDEINPDQGDVVLRHIMAGESLADVARTTGVLEGTVKSRWRLAKQVLREKVARR